MEYLFSSFGLGRPRHSNSVVYLLPLSIADRWYSGPAPSLTQTGLYINHLDHELPVPQPQQYQGHEVVTISRLPLQVLQPRKNAIAQASIRAQRRRVDDLYRRDEARQIRNFCLSDGHGELPSAEILQ